MSYTNQKSGGFDAYADNVQDKTFFRATERFTKTVTVKSGEVLKAFSFLETDSDGKDVAYSSLGLQTISGVTCFDVDATGGDVKASAFTKASFWQEALVWKVDIATDTIDLADGTTIAVTAYDTGASGTTAASDLLKQKFVDGSGFAELGFLSAGETA